MSLGDLWSLDIPLFLANLETTVESNPQDELQSTLYFMVAILVAMAVSFVLFAMSVRHQRMNAPPGAPQDPRNFPFFGANGQRRGLTEVQIQGLVVKKYVAVGEDEMSKSEEGEMSEVGKKEAGEGEGLEVVHTTFNPTTHVQGDPLHDLCAICLDPFKTDDELTILPCQHMYHSTECIVPWLRKHNECPSCRSVVCSNGGANQQARVQEMQTWTVAASAGGDQESVSQLESDDAWDPPAQRRTFPAATEDSDVGSI